jgi:hypothetical protein
MTATRPLTDSEQLFVWELTRRRCIQERFRFTGPSRVPLDGDDAHHDVFVAMIQRATARWDRLRPLDAYVGAALKHELTKYRQRMFRDECP